MLNLRDSQRVHVGCASLGVGEVHSLADSKLLTRSCYMMRHQLFRSSIVDGTRVQLKLPEDHPAYSLDGQQGVVLRCLGCSDDSELTDVVDYLVKIDGDESIIVVSSEWIKRPK